MSQPPTPAPRTIQLLHSLADGSQHVDWLIAQDPRGREPLITFRVGQRIDQLTVGQQLTARRIADHRPVYLGYEGPISDNRGSVSRLSRGTVISLEQQPDIWHLEVSWHSQTGAPQNQRLRMEREGPDEWTIVCTSRDSNSPTETQDR